MSEKSQVSVWRLVQATGVVVVLGFFLFETLTILNPAFLFLLLWAVLLPFRGREGHTLLLSIAALLTLIWVLSSAGSILAPFILSLVLAYVLDPLLDRMEARKIPRSIAVIMLILPSIALLATLVFIGLPAGLGYLGEILGSVPILLERIVGWFEASQAYLLSVDIPFLDGAAIAAELQSIDTDAVVRFVQERQEAFTNYLWEGVLGVGRGIGSVLGILGYVVLTPVLTFYLMRDWDPIKERLVGLIPLPHREATVDFLQQCDGLVSSYLRGQVTVAAIIGILTGVGFALVGFEYAALIGLVAGVFSIVPYLGVVMSLIPALFIALVSGSVLASLLKVAAVFAAVQLLDGSVISPRIVGDSVGIHPVWVVLAMSLGGFFFGIVGLLVAVPVAAIVKLLLGIGVERYLVSDFYLGKAPDAPR